MSDDEKTKPPDSYVTYDINHDSWAPYCLHNEEDEAKARLWARKILEYPDDWEDPKTGFAESALWKLGDLEVDLAFHFYSDMWIAVDTTGKLGDQTVLCRIEADEFWLALLETYRWWKEQLDALPKPEITGEEIL